LLYGRDRGQTSFMSDRMTTAFLVKHNDAVLNAEVDVMLELSSSLMKHLVQLRGESG